jgi:hypothetical protein
MRAERAWYARRFGGASRTQRDWRRCQGNAAHAAPLASQRGPARTQRVTTWAAPDDQHRRRTASVPPRARLAGPHGSVLSAETPRQGREFVPKLSPNGAPRANERDTKSLFCRQFLRVSDGIRTRDRRDHNPRDRVPQGAFSAPDRASCAFQFRPVPLKIVHEFVHEPRFRLAGPPRVDSVSAPPPVDDASRGRRRAVGATSSTRGVRVERLRPRLPTPLATPVTSPATAAYSLSPAASSRSLSGCTPTSSGGANDAFALSPIGCVAVARRLRGDRSLAAIDGLCASRSQPHLQGPRG